MLANSMTSAERKCPGQNDLTTAAAITHLAYFSNYKLLGGYIGAEFLVPLVDVDSRCQFCNRIIMNRGWVT